MDLPHIVARFGLEIIQGGFPMVESVDFVVLSDSPSPELLLASFCARPACWQAGAAAELLE